MTDIVILIRGRKLIFSCYFFRTHIVDFDGSTKECIKLYNSPQEARDAGWKFHKRPDQNDIAVCPECAKDEILLGWL